MKSIFSFILLILFYHSFGQVRVKSYYRNDGTFVQSHYRSNPDGNPYNNWSFPGNTNPYTGTIATGNSSTYLDNYYNRGSDNYTSSIYSLTNLLKASIIPYTNLSTYTSPIYSTSNYSFPSYSTNSTTNNYSSINSSMYSSPIYSNSTNYSHASTTENNISNYSLPKDSLAKLNNNGKREIGNYFMVTSEKAYFHNEPLFATIRNAYLIKGDKGTITDQRNNFYFVIFTNFKGQKTSGWIDINTVTLLSVTNNQLTTETLLKVAVSKAYFFEEPKYSERKNAYLVFGDILYAYKYENGFIYTVYKNSAGITTAGWINEDDVN